MVLPGDLSRAGRRPAVERFQTGQDGPDQAEGIAQTMAEDDLPQDAKPVQRIGSYRLVEPLGSGGMSSVYRAEHSETGVEVALKVLSRNLARNRTLLQRFLREAKSAEALEHPNIVAIYDHGVDNGQYYLVLEYVPGGDLHDWVRKYGPMPAAEAIAVVKGVAEGLKYAAEQGVIHRDIKPANILLSTTGTVKVADLGLALQAEAEDERVTREGTTVGTVDYMSPEQARNSRATSERSDIYSLGCTFFFMLTGQPPFPGGDITEKLTRHFTASAPDPRKDRPELSPEISAVVRKMMAKRPENRFGTYAELLDAFAALPEARPNSDEPETLDALFDDEDEPPPTLQSLVDATDDAESPPMYAVFDDDEDVAPASVSFQPLDLSEEAEDLVPVAEEPRMPEVSMAELAAMIDDDDREIPAPKNSRPSVARPAPTLITPRTGRGGVDRPGPESKEESVEVGHLPGKVSIPSRRMSKEEASWLKALVIAGVGLVAAVIAFDQLYRATLTDAPPVTLTEGVQESVAPLPVAEVPEPVNPEGPARSKSPAIAAKAKNFKTTTDPAKVLPLNSAAKVKPPAERDIPRAAGVHVDPAVEQRFLPEWAREAIPDQIGGARLHVGRLLDPRDPERKPSLSAALDVIGNGTIEITDNGPYFERDLRDSGEVKLIRARSGYRPMIRLETPKFESVPGRTAFFLLESRSLILDGLDVIVDLKDLPRDLTSIFSIQGGSLTLRNCTFTIVNRAATPFTIVRTVGEGGRSRIRVEECLLRGSFRSAIDLGAGAADVLIARSGIVNGLGTTIGLSRSGAADRRIYLDRSLVASRGPFLEQAEGSGGIRAGSVGVKAVASCFDHLASADPTPMIVLHEDNPDFAETIAWDGEANDFSGWNGWLASGKNATIRVSHLDAARTLWNGTEAHSRETIGVPSLPVPAERVGPSTLPALVGDHAELVTFFPTPHPCLLEETIESFPRPLIRGLTDASGLPRATGNPASTAIPLTTAPGIRELTFDADAPTWSGDLGRFLGASIKPNDRLIRVRVSGSGTHDWTPVSIPDHTSVEIDVNASPANRPLSWVCARPRPGATLLSVKQGSLSLNGVTIVSNEPARAQQFVRVEDGHLILNRCRFLSRGPATAEGQGLIDFHASGADPLPAVKPPLTSWPFDGVVDRPTCRITECILNSRGEAISATLGRGMVAISHSALAAETTAIRLRPALTAPRKFGADLWLDHCTVVAARAVVQLDAVPGSKRGPDRPWLVSTHRSAFFGTYERRSQDSILLRADRDAFSQGYLFWQSYGDAFELSHFLGAIGAPLPSDMHPDVVRQWFEVWGSNHVHSSTGPRTPSGTMTRRLVTRALRPGDVVTADLFIDPTFPKDDPPGDLGVDLSRLGIKPPARVSRAR